VGRNAHFAQMKILNARTDSLPPDYVYIGRPSKWGNPFEIGKDGNREEVIEKYRSFISSNQNLLDSLDELKGKTLVCWCKPSKCHGDVLVELLKAKEFEDVLEY